MSSRVIGIDPGQKGGIAAIGENDRWIKPMPDTIVETSNFLGSFHSKILGDDVLLAVVEKVHAMPKQGVSSTFKFGVGYGAILGILTTLEIPFIEVTPQTWMKTVFVGHPWKKQKKYSTIWAPKRWPDVDFKASDRCRVVHDGMTDAACLAEYGRLYLSDNHNRTGGMR